MIVGMTMTHMVRMFLHIIRVKRLLVNSNVSLSQRITVRVKIFLTIATVTAQQ
jgi:hypothetical protein